MTVSPRFAVFDIDGTFFRSSLYFETVKELINQGHLSAQLSRSINEAYTKWRRLHDDESFWSYADILMSAHQENLPRLQAHYFDQALASVLEQQRDYVYTFPRTLAENLKKDGYLLFAISGSQQEIVEQFCRYHGFDDWLGSLHERDHDGQFTGGITVTHTDKRELLNQLVEKHGATFNESVGIGDTHGDITILKMVETPIAFNPNSKLYEYATREGWKLVFERKDVIVELQKNDSDYVLINNRPQS